jgi:molybdopterin-guanine dinucleotide biosynthesis protein A
MAADAPRRDLRSSCTGALVAGGRGSRLGGTPKGLLRVAGEPLAARTLRLFGGLFGASLVVANDPTPYAAFRVPIVPDVVPGRGAPGGLHAALAAARTEWVFTAGCDMPCLAEAPIRWLWDRRAGAPAVAVVWRGRLQPLHAFWSVACLPAVDRLLRAGQPSMWQLATAVGARFVPEEEWRAVDPEGRAFENVNTPDDVARLGLALPLPPGARP